MFVPPTPTSTYTYSTTGLATRFSPLDDGLPPSTPPYNILAQSSPSSLSSNTTTEGEWYATDWLGPVSWALAFYCVLSFLLLCCLYGQGWVDGKGNIIRSRNYRGRARYDGRGDVVYMGYAPSFASDVDARGQDGGEEEGVARRERVLRDMLLDRIGTTGERARSQEGSQHLQQQTMSDRLEAERVERALAGVGLL